MDARRGDHVQGTDSGAAGHRCDQGLPRLKLDSSLVAVDADLDNPVLRPLLDILTLGLLEVFVFTPRLEGAEEDAGSELSRMIQNQISRSLLGPFASGLKIIGMDHFMTRISAVPWIEPSIAEFREEGLMIGGRALPGIKHHPRLTRITHLGKEGNKTARYGFDNAYFVSRERANDLYLGARMYIANRVKVVVRRTNPYFRNVIEEPLGCGCFGDEGEDAVVVMTLAGAAVR